MSEKILISAKDLKIGGIEKSLIILIKKLLEHGYIVTLVLEKAEGILIEELDSNVKVIEYKPCSISIFGFRKIINFCKRLSFHFKYHKKFDIAISYATYSKTASYVARCASNNSILWCHADYLSLFNGQKSKVEIFFKEICHEKFSKIVFVAKSGKNTFLEVFPRKKQCIFLQ